MHRFRTSSAISILLFSLVLGGLARPRFWELFGVTLSGRRRRVLFLDPLNFRTLSRYTNDPGLFRDDITFALGECDSLLVCVNEVQKAPFLLDEVHYALERFVVRGDSDSKERGAAERRRIQFILSGSSTK